MSHLRTFIKVHDGIEDHPKIAPLSDAAFRVLITSWGWCRRHNTDGWMPTTLWVRRASAKVRHELVTARLVHEHGSDVEFHDYLEHQQSAEQRQCVSEQRRRAGQAGGLAKAKQTASGVPSTPLSKTQAEVEEEEEEETPSVSSAGKPAAKHAIPDDWQPSEADLLWAKTNCSQVNIERETPNFVGYFTEKATKRPGWSRSWRAWMSGAQGRMESRTLRAVADEPTGWKRMGSWDV